jgi:hypothetical protein
MMYQFLRKGYKRLVRKRNIRYLTLLIFHIRFIIFYITLLIFLLTLKVSPSLHEYVRVYPQQGLEPLLQGYAVTPVG